MIVNPFILNLTLEGFCDLLKHGIISISLNFSSMSVVFSLIYLVIIPSIFIRIDMGGIINTKITFDGILLLITV